jgi:ribosomal protein L32
MLIIILRILIILAISYWLSKIVADFIRRIRTDKKDNHINKNPHSSQKDDVLDICPECGKLKRKNHRCP